MSPPPVRSLDDEEHKPNTSSSGPLRFFTDDGSKYLNEPSMNENTIPKTLRETNCMSQPLQPTQRSYATEEHVANTSNSNTPYFYANYGSPYNNDPNECAPTSHHEMSENTRPKARTETHERTSPAPSPLLPYSSANYGSTCMSDLVDSRPTGHHETTSLLPSRNADIPCANPNPSSPTENKREFFCMKIALVVLGLCLLACVAVIIWLSVHRDGITPNCKIPPKPANGNFTCFNRSNTINEECRLSCIAGYSIEGNGTIECSGGKWKEKPPTCVLNCPLIKPPNKGKATCTKQNSPVNECTFWCNEGYSLLGNSTIDCMNGTWKGKRPTCIPDCPALQPIKNGTKPTCSRENELNSICKFTCDKYHELKGNSSVTCQENGTWSALEPKCECPLCYIGDKCQDSIYWKNVLKAFDQKPFEKNKTVQVNYGGHSFTCSTKFYVDAFRFTGTCTDKNTGTSSTCEHLFRN